MKERKKPTNFQVAVYLVGMHGANLDDEKLKAVAKLYNFKANVLIRNYRSIVKINSLFE